MNMNVTQSMDVCSHLGWSQVIMKYSFPYKLHNREAILSPAVKCARNMVKDSNNGFHPFQSLLQCSMSSVGYPGAYEPSHNHTRACEGHRLPFQ